MATYTWHTNVNGNWVAYTMVDGVEVSRKTLTDSEAAARKLPKVRATR